MRKASSRNYLSALLGSLTLVLGTCVVINATVDPLQYFRKPSFYTPYFTMRERYRNPGLARNYEHRIVVTGTSTSENFYPSEVERRFGGPVIKLSVSGGTGYEQRLAVEIALQAGGVKRVIWGADYFAFCHEPREVSPFIGEFPYYLYKKPSIGLYKYLVSISTLKYTAIALSRSMTNNPRHLDLLNTWDRKSVFGCEPVLTRFLDPETVREGERRIIEDQVSYEPETIRANFEENVLALVRRFPGVVFDLVLPPYSGLRNTWTKTFLPQDYAAEIYFREFLFQRIAEYPNMRLHDFQLDPGIVMDLSNYKDMAHFSKRISDLILDAIVSGEYQVHEDSVDRVGLDSVLMEPSADLCRYVR